MGPGVLSQGTNFIQHQQSSLVGKHLEYRNDFYIVRFGTGFQFINLLSGKCPASNTYSRICLKAKSIFEVDHKGIHLELCQETNNVLKIFHRGNLAVANLILNTTHGKKRPVVNLDSGQRRTTTAKNNLLKSYSSIKNPR